MIGMTYIDWEWQPPLFDGGLTITDYEISYDAFHKYFDKKKGIYIYNIYIMYVYSVYLSIYIYYMIFLYLY